MDLKSSARVFEILHSEITLVNSFKKRGKMNFLKFLLVFICLYSTAIAQRDAFPRIKKLGGNVSPYQWPSVNPAWVVDLKDTKISDGDLKELEEVKNFSSGYFMLLDVSGTTVTDNGLKFVSDAETLEWIDLSNTAIDGSGFEHLRNLQRLKCIILQECKKINDKSLESLPPLKNLQSLNLRNTSITHVSMKKILTYKKLNILNLRDTGIKNESVAMLASLKNLKGLDLGETEISDSALEKMKDLKLQSLDLTKSKIVGSGLKFLSPEELLWIKLEGGNVTDEGMSGLKHLTSLQDLNLSGNSIGDKGLAKLKKLKDLSKMNLSSSKVTDKGLANLSGLANLNQLILSKCKINGSGLNNLKKTNLAYLDVSETLISENFSNLNELPDLRALILCQCMITDEMINKLKHHQMIVLEVSGNPITDAGLAGIIKNLNLRFLSLENCKGITDKSVAGLAELKEMDQLNLSGTSFTQKGIDVLKKKLPDANIIF